MNLRKSQRVGKLEKSRKLERRAIKSNSCGDEVIIFVKAWVYNGKAVGVEKSGGIGDGNGGELVVS